MNLLVIKYQRLEKHLFTHFPTHHNLYNLNSDIFIIINKNRILNKFLLFFTLLSIHHEEIQLKQHTAYDQKGLKVQIHTLIGIN